MHIKQFMKGLLFVTDFIALEAGFNELLRMWNHNCKDIFRAV